MAKHMIYHAYKVPPKVRVSDFGKSRTRQSEAAATNINAIMRKYEKTGLLPKGDARQAFYADVSEMGDYRTALENVRLAEESFMELPATLRREFQNDPAEFLDFCSDPTNRDKMAEMGLIEKKVEDRPDPPPKAAEGEETAEAVS